MSSLRTMGVLLAAGGGTRFRAADGSHKLLAELRGVPLWRHSLDHLLAAGFEHNVVITGAATLSGLADTNAQVAHNGAWASGQASSLQMAIAAARAAGVDAIVVGLADQPFVPPEAWRAVADAADGVPAGRRHLRRRVGPQPGSHRQFAVAGAADGRRRRGSLSVTEVTRRCLHGGLRRLCRRHRHAGGPRAVDKLLNEFTVNRPIEEAWTVLTDVERIARHARRDSCRRSRATSTAGWSRSSSERSPPRSRARPASPSATTPATAPCSRPRAATPGKGNADAFDHRDAGERVPRGRPSASCPLTCASTARSPSSAGGSWPTSARS